MWREELDGVMRPPLHSNPLLIPCPHYLPTPNYGPQLLYISTFMHAGSTTNHGPLIQFTVLNSSVYPNNPTPHCAGPKSRYSVILKTVLSLTASVWVFPYSAPQRLLICLAIQKQLAWMWGPCVFHQRAHWKISWPSSDVPNFAYCGFLIFAHTFNRQYTKWCCNSIQTSL